MDTEAQPLGMSINWTKTKTQDLGGCDAPCQRVNVKRMKWRSLSHLYRPILAPSSIAHVAATKREREYSMLRY